MRKYIQTFVVAATAAIAMAAPRAAQAQDFKVVVNSANAVDALTADEASKIFLKQAPKFANGTTAAPVDQKGAVRASFTKAVHGKAVAAVDTYWQQQIFSGKYAGIVTASVPPGLSTRKSSSSAPTSSGMCSITSLAMM